MSALLAIVSRDADYYLMLSYYPEGRRIQDRPRRYSK